MRIMFLALLIIDRLTKWLVEHFMLPHESIPVIAGVFHLTYVQNAGAAFGIMENSRWLFVASAAIFIVIGCLFYYKIAREGFWFRYGAMALFSGAAGNLIDRVFNNGLVTDFFDFRVWPVFNIADIAIVLGAFGMILDTFFLRRENKRHEEEQSRPKNRIHEKKSRDCV